MEILKDVCRFQHDVDCKGAEDLLMDAPPGTFLIRPSSRGKTVCVLCIKTEIAVVNFTVSIAKHGISCVNHAQGKAYRSLKHFIVGCKENGGLVTGKGDTVHITSAVYAKDITTQRFFHPNLSGKQAERKLLDTNCPDESFLVRRSGTDRNQYVISVRSDTTVHHIKIRRKGVFFFVYPAKQFNSIDDMIDHYMENALIEATGAVLNLRHPLNTSAFSSTMLESRIEEMATLTNSLYGSTGFTDELQKIQSDTLSHGANAVADIVGQSSENRIKNRYKNIVPKDRTRVILKGRAQDLGDYINADHVKNEEGQPKYISTQAPLKHTMGDFWHMIYQEDTRQIVNLTNSSELSRGKTVEYWPTEFDEPMECNGLSIALIGDNEVHGFMYREFAITNTQTNITKNTWMFNFEEWPDNGEPVEVEAVVELVETVRSHYAHHGGGAWVVHCSAGIGRAGVFIAIDRFRSFLRTNPMSTLSDKYDDVEFNIASVVSNIRQYRNHAVQTESQYKSIYEALLVMVQNEQGLVPLATDQVIDWGYVQEDEYDDDDLHGNVDAFRQSVPCAGSKETVVRAEGDDDPYFRQPQADTETAESAVLDHVTENDIYGNVDTFRQVAASSTMSGVGDIPTEGVLLDILAGCGGNHSDSGNHGDSGLYGNASIFLQAIPPTTSGVADIPTECGADPYTNVDTLPLVPSGESTVLSDGRTELPMSTAGVSVVEPSMETTHTHSDHIPPVPNSSCGDEERGVVNGMNGSGTAGCGAEAAYTNTASLRSIGETPADRAIGTPWDTAVCVHEAQFDVHKALPSVPVFLSHSVGEGLNPGDRQARADEDCDTTGRSASLGCPVIESEGKAVEEPKTPIGAWFGAGRVGISMATVDTEKTDTDKASGTSAIDTSSKDVKTIVATINRYSSMDVLQSLPVPMPGSGTNSPRSGSRGGSYTRLDVPTVCLPTKGVPVTGLQSGSAGSAGLNNSTVVDYVGKGEGSAMGVCKDAQAETVTSVEDTAENKAGVGITTDSAAQDVAKCSATRHTTSTVHPTQIITMVNAHTDISNTTDIAHTTSVSPTHAQHTAKNITSTDTTNTNSGRTFADTRPLGKDIHATKTARKDYPIDALSVGTDGNHGNLEPVGLAHTTEPSPSSSILLGNPRVKKDNVNVCAVSHTSAVHTPPVPSMLPPSIPALPPTVSINSHQSETGSPSNIHIMPFPSLRTLPMATVTLPSTPRLPAQTPSSTYRKSSNKGTNNPLNTIKAMGGMKSFHKSSMHPKSTTMTLPTAPPALKSSEDVMAGIAAMSLYDDNASTGFHPPAPPRGSNNCASTRGSLTRT